ncbi:MAG: helix-turn-helix domain-containing protein [Bacteroidota bacterium]
MGLKVSELEPAEYVSKFISRTNKNIFLTGKAGTGKTTLLYHIVKNTYKKCLVAAPTGIAAINAKGVTLHSLFQLPFGSFIPVIQSRSYTENSKLTDPNTLIKGLQMFDRKRALLRELELLIIDEVSMLRADMLDAIDLILRYVRRNTLPFGGVQVLFIGDLLQLPPVVKDDEWVVLKEHYTSIYFFDSMVLKQHKPVYIELDKIYRQADNNFINLLNHLRNDEMTLEDYSMLNSYYKPDFKALPSDNYITLTTHNFKANEINKTFLNSLTNKSFLFEASIEGDFNEYAYPIEKTLELKIGAQVMFVKNDPTGQQRFFNGRIGTISTLSDERIEVEFVETNSKIIVEPYKWENVKYKLNTTSNEIEENTAGTFTQYPIKLAWAITVHKSQGLTFDKAIIDIGDAFASGQVYVALSRLRSLQGLVLTSLINVKSIGKDGKINVYAKTQSEEQQLNNLLSSETHLFIKNYVIRSFNFETTVREIQEHADTYVKKDETRSVKQRHHTWAKELENDLLEIKPISEKFRNQVLQITAFQAAGYLDHLLNRVKAASSYFIPVLKNISSKIFKQISKVKSEKKIKTYIDELVQLEVMIFEHVKLINKASFLIEAIINNKELNGDELKKLYTDFHRDEQLRDLFATSTKPGDNKNLEAVIKNKKTKSQKTPKEKKSKIDTKLETFKLYKQGNTSEIIAQQRGMSLTTIEGHLAHYVTKGELKATDFISEEKMNNIITVAKKLNTLFFGQIKQSLGDEYTYSEIKFAVAGYLSSEPDNK